MIKNIIKTPCLTSLFMVIAASGLASHTNAENCPNFNKITFKTVSEYNKYKSTVNPCYTMPDISAKTTAFPITFDNTQSVDILTTSHLSKKPPFTGDKVVCHILWKDKDNHSIKGEVILNEKVTTTSKDWRYLDDHEISCIGPASAKQHCTFKH